MAVDVQAHLRKDFGAMLEFEGEWAQIRVPDVLDELRQRGYSDGEARDFLLWFARSHPGHVATVKVSERLLLMFRTSRQVEAEYISDVGGAWVSHLKIHRDAARSLEQGDEEV